MELKKLQTLAEGSGGELAQVRRQFDIMEGAVNSVMNFAEGSQLKNLLKKWNFPETESKAFIQSVKKMANEFDDLKMSVITGVEQDLNQEQD
jgi:predicted translin family RNA/ssDNA-binding protein